eukprot:TRINITY_DN1978_c0_g2_i2.p1 TRINITY_DN1978_c0_g2~~TRINITY_DN1978_c0_g2_i2.p1  ORF type:complete len:468 (+),score=193.19 TRINITY_DN1978_c0_g2_i2:101-1405(+)
MMLRNHFSHTRFLSQRFSAINRICSGARSLHSSAARRVQPAIPLDKKPRIKAASTLTVPKPNSMKQIYEFAERPQQSISLKHLLDFGTNLSENVLVASAAWIWSEIPTRLARQVVAIDRLPYGLCLMPSIREIRDNYVRSFDELVAAAEPRTFDDCTEFTTLLDGIYNRHGGMFGQVGRGMFELQDEMAKTQEVEDIATFLEVADMSRVLDAFYTTRVGIRLLLSQHVALMRQWERGETPGAESSHMVGVIDTRCSPAEVAHDAIDTALVICRDATGFAPEITVDGTTDLHFPYLTDHLFYMLVELLKNSLRATVEFHGDDAELPPIKVIIAHSDENEDVAIKVSDQGGGIPRSAMPRVWSYMYTTAQVDPQLTFGHLDHATTAPLAGLGYGLPISRQYARYFGGDLQVVSMEGYGTDCYLHLRRLGDKEEPLP